MNRRALILTGLLAAPLLVRTPGLLMPVRKVDLSRTWFAATYPRGLEDGSSWENAIAFRKAVNKARTGDQVMIADGDYSFTVTDRTRGEPRIYRIIGGHSA